MISRDPHSTNVDLSLTVCFVPHCPFAPPEPRFSAPQTTKMYRTVPRMAGYVFPFQFLLIRVPRTVPESGGAMLAGRPIVI